MRQRISCACARTIASRRGIAYLLRLRARLRVWVLGRVRVRVRARVRVGVRGRVRVKVRVRAPPLRDVPHAHVPVEAGREKEVRPAAHLGDRGDIWEI